MEIVFTNHILDKINNLSVSGITISKKLILKTVNSPDDINSDEDYPNLIASAKIDKDRVIRVVYRVESGKIILITFYPAKKGRYY